MHLGVYVSLELLLSHVPDCNSPSPRLERTLGTAESGRLMSVVSGLPRAIPVSNHPGSHAPHQMAGVRRGLRAANARRAPQQPTVDANGPLFPTATSPSLAKRQQPSSFKALEQPRQPLHPPSPRSPWAPMTSESRLSSAPPGKLELLSSFSGLTSPRGVYRVKVRNA